MHRTYRTFNISAIPADVVVGLSSSASGFTYASPISSTRSLDADGSSKEGTIRGLPPKTLAADTPSSAAVTMPSVDVADSRLMPDPGFPSLETSVIEDTSPYSTLQTSWPFAVRFNVAINMTCDQPQLQSIMTNLSSLGTDINIHFQRV